MKRLFSSILLASSAILSAVSALADTLVMQDGSETKCSVIRISETEITYTLPGQKVERIVGKPSVFKILYADGTDETITPIGTAAPQQEEIVLCTGVKPTFTTDYSHLPPASREYRLFDYFNENGVEGIVIEVTDDGRHGKVLGLHSKMLRFAEKNIIEPFSTGGRSLTDGEKNLNALNELLATNPTISIDDFPAHKWVTSLGPGWYVPSFGELLKLAWLMETKDSKGKKMKKHLKKALNSHGGRAFNWKDSCYYGTSSETEDYAQYSQVGLGLFANVTATPHKNGIYVLDLTLTENIVKDNTFKNAWSRYDRYTFRAFHKF